jgi:hypothetical protein
MLKPPYRPPNWKVCNVSFDDAEFRRLVFQKGLPLEWEQATPCPCSAEQTFGEVTGQNLEHRLDCPACKGFGVIYTAPQPITGMVAAASEDERVVQAYGPEAAGYIFITLLPENIPSEWDRFTVKGGHRILTELKTRTSDPIEKLRYPIRRRTDIHQPANPNDPPVQSTNGVLGLWRQLPDGRTNPTPLLEGVHFVVTTAGEIDWTLGIVSGDAPTPGTRYSLRYFAELTVVVRDFPYIKRDFYDIEFGDVELRYLPNKVLCKIEQLGIRGAE